MKASCRLALDPSDSDAQHAVPDIVTAAPDSAAGLVQRAAPTGPLDERIRLLQQARKTDPAYTPAAYALANLFYIAGRHKEALTEIDDALAHERTKPGYFV